MVDKTGRRRSVPDLTPRAIRSAIAALKRRRQQIAFDANMYKRLRYDIPYTRTCAAEYDRLTQAIADLEATLPSKRNSSAPSPAKQDAQTADTTQWRLFDEP